jgi:hypothetical protein
MPVSRHCKEVLSHFAEAANEVQELYRDDEEWERVCTLSEDERRRVAQALHNIAMLADSMSMTLEKSLEREGVEHDA